MIVDLAASGGVVVELRVSHMALRATLPGSLMRSAHANADADAEAE